MTRRQPDDEWSYLRPEGDDERTDDASAEELALHTVGGDLRPPGDPGRSDDSALADDGDGAPTAQWYDDEEPETTGSARTDDDDEHEPDLEEILESQHYAFPPDEPEDADEAEDDDADRRSAAR